MTAERDAQAQHLARITARADYEYERNGTGNMFMLFTRSKASGTLRLQTAVPPSITPKSSETYRISNFRLPIALVQDHLNTHAKASLHEAFASAEAKRLSDHLEWLYTPKHGIWLNMAESELGVLASQCLVRRIPDKETLTEEVASRQKSRNKNLPNAIWHFTIADARIKLKHIYPRFE